MIQELQTNVKALDITLQDLDRRDIDTPDYKVKEVLPQFFRESYPKLINLLDQYYEFEDSDASPSRLLNDLFRSRDITQTDAELLKYIEDELLLGQSYFEGFQDKEGKLLNIRTHYIVLRVLNIRYNSSLEPSLV